jgi:hypothetical protein
METRVDVDNDSGGEREGDRIFLGAIMGRFSTPSKGPRGSAKRKIAELRVIHEEPPKVAKKRPLLGFTDSEKVNGVPNE